MATTRRSLDKLPWGSPSPGSAGSFDRGVVKLSNKAFNALSMSAPNLNFDETELFEDFAEPDFHTQEFPKSKRTTASKTSKKSPTSVKVRASELSRNMSSKEREIKGLFNQWKQKNSVDGTMTAGEDINIFHSPTKKQYATIKGGLLSPQQASGSPLKLSPVRKNHYPRTKDDDESTFVPSPHPAFDEEGDDNAVPLSPTPSSPSLSKQARSSGNSPRRKKVAVRLKASDLNLSAEKKKEIEDMFLKWKCDTIDSNSQVTVIFSPASDKRWNSEDEAASPSKSRRERAPKAVRRQRSASLEPEFPVKPRPNILSRRFSNDKMSVNDKHRGSSKYDQGGSTESCSTTQDSSCSSDDSESIYRGRCREPRRSGSRRPTREDSTKRLAIRGKSSSRSPNRRNQSRSRGGRREERRRSQSQGTLRRRMSNENLNDSEPQKPNGNDDEEKNGGEATSLAARSQSAPRRPRRAGSIRDRSTSPRSREKSDDHACPKKRSSSTARRRRTARPSIVADGNDVTGLT